VFKGLEGVVAESGGFIYGGICRKLKVYANLFKYLYTGL
jgi:hypothetical protein